MPTILPGPHTTISRPRSKQHGSALGGVKRGDAGAGVQLGFQ
ncbi:hypothetical protein ACFQ3Z_46210 [Streptomyces nogalater]